WSHRENPAHRLSLSSMTAHPPSYPLVPALSPWRLAPSSNNPAPGRRCLLLLLCQSSRCLLIDNPCLGTLPRRTRARSPRRRQSTHGLGNIRTFLDPFV